MSVHVADIDDQHKVLFSLINNLNYSLKKGKTTGELRLGLLKTLSYAVLHFRTEENLMRKYDYPDTDDHMTEHAKFVRRLKDCLDHSYGSAGCQPKDLMDFMRTWALEHELKLDHKYADHIAVKNKSQFEPSSGPGGPDHVG